MLANFERQSTRVFLVVVENGAAIGSFPKHLPYTRVLRSSPGVTNALNVGLEYVKQHAHEHDWFCKVDSDDWYGAEYAVYATQHKCAATVQLDTLLRNKASRLWLVQPQHGAPVLPGPTLAGLVSTAPYFPPRLYGEGQAWLADLTKQGLPVQHLRAGHFCHMRSTGGQHTADNDDDEFLMSDHVVSDLGMFSPSFLDVVRAPYSVQRSVVPSIPFDLTRTLQWRELPSNFRDALPPETVNEISLHMRASPAPPYQGDT